MAQRGENCLIVVAGQPAPITNSTIAGIIDEVGEGVHIADIFGATAGIGGIAEGRLTDLGAQKQKTIEGLRRTPGSVLSGRHRILSDDDGTRIIETLRANDIGIVFLLGGLPIVGLLRFLIAAAEKASYPLLALGAPLSAENEVDAGDHTPGYGSAARFVANTIRDAGLDAAVAEEPITVVEVLGAQTGWLAAATALARDEQHPAPHVILTPERAVDSDTVVDELRRAYQKYGYAVAVTTESAKAEGGASLSGAALAQLLTEKIGVPARLEKWGATARSSQANVARADAEEAYNLGSLLVRLSGDECSGYLVTVQRDLSERPERGDRETRERGYRSVEGTSRLDQVSDEPRRLSEEYFAESGTQVSQAFLDWARPLIGGALPEYVALSE
jgi:6-phosphofructokinase 1